MIALMVLLLDFGPVNAPVMNQWTALTPATAATATAPGWVAPVGLTAQDKAWPREVENRSRGTNEPPPVYTNELIEDAIIGAKPATLRVLLQPGEYELWFAAGSSLASRGQVWDFTVSVEGASARVQMQQGYWFETRKLRFKAIGATDIVITPRSKWIISGMAIYPVAQATEVMKSFLDVHEKTIHTLPPDILAKWKLTEHQDPIGSMPTSSEQDRARGYVTHHRHYLENVYPNTIPYREEMNPTLEAFATLGEYEPLTFSIYALKDLTGCRVSVSPLKGPGEIPAERIDIKMVQYAYARPNYTAVGRYYTVPDYLRPFETVNAPEDRNQRFWLTVHVPEKAPAGVYQGQATFAPGNAPAATIPIRFRVLPIILQKDPSKTYGIYYRDPLDIAASATDDFSRDFFTKQAEIQAADMNAHGTVLCVPLSLYISMPKNSKAPLDLKFEWDGLIQKIDRCKRFGYGGPFVMSLNTGGLYERHQGERFGSHLRGAKPAPEAFAQEMTAMVKWIEQERKTRGLSEFLYYPVDEPGQDKDAVSFMVQCLKAIRDAGARTYVTADPTRENFDPMKPWVDVWCTQPFLPAREEILKDTAARGVQYWCYPNHINGENDHTTVAGARMTYGFGFWRSGFSTLIPWIYSSTNSHPFNNLDGSSQDFFNRPGLDGAVWPVPMWEAYREGYDDFRYVYTCEQMIAKARAAGKTAIADHARATLDHIWNAIAVKAKYKLDSDVWGYREFDLYRWQIAQEILAMKRAVE